MTYTSSTSNSFRYLRHINHHPRGRTTILSVTAVSPAVLLALPQSSSLPRGGARPHCRLPFPRVPSALPAPLLACFLSKTSGEPACLRPSSPALHFIFKLIRSYKSGLIIYYSLNVTYLKLNSFNLSKEALLPDLYTLINPALSQVQRAKTSGIPDSSHRQWVSLQSLLHPLPCNSYCCHLTSGP